MGSKTGKFPLFTFLFWINVVATILAIVFGGIPISTSMKFSSYDSLNNVKEFNDMSSDTEKDESKTSTVGIACLAFGILLILCSLLFAWMALDFGLLIFGGPYPRDTFSSGYHKYLYNELKNRGREDNTSL